MNRQCSIKTGKKMKLKKIIWQLLFITLFFSCNNEKNEQHTTAVKRLEPVIVQHITNDNEDFFIENNFINEIKIENKPEIITPPYIFNENYNLLTEYSWSLSDGRRYENQPNSLDWVGYMTPHVIFKKFNFPEDYLFYQEQLRKERFTLVYQTDEIDILYILENSSSSGFYNMEYGIDFNSLSLVKNNVSHGRQNRDGEQLSLDYPLVGVWGNLPYLTEYRIIDHSEGMFYMEIDRAIPFWAVRRGTYLLRKTGENTFETISSFPEGHLNLEVIDERRILLRPMFTLPDDEEGLTGLLVMHRSYNKISNDAD